MDKEILQQPNRIPQEETTPITPLKGFEVSKDSQPGVADVKVIQSRKKEPPVSLRFQGLKEGVTSITLIEKPLPVNLVPFKQTYNVLVKRCIDKEIIQAPPLREGFSEEQADVAKPPPKKEKDFDDAKDATFTTPTDPLALLINDARLRSGHSPLAALPQPLAEMAKQYSSRLVVQMITTSQCEHNLAEWESLRQATSASTGLTPIGEVLACPRPRGNWDPRTIFAQWNQSTHHHDILLNRSAASHLSCAHVVDRDKEAAVCMIWATIKDAKRRHEAKYGSGPYALPFRSPW